jgi:bifunctional non-homologous end joining protein LigD
LSPANVVIEPCHRKPGAEPPTGPGWLHEIKWDGYRAQAHLADGKAVVFNPQRP